MIKFRVIGQILDLARWAPSGDNTQPWRFELADESNVIVHGYDTRDHCVYDLDGRPSQMSLGAMLETLAIAATTHGLRALINRRLMDSETRSTFDVRFVADSGLTCDPLIHQIETRSVQRRAMKWRALTPPEKRSLEECVAPRYRVLWLEDWRVRVRVARLMYANAKLRLTLPEAYPVHRDVIEWNSRYSVHRIPDQALGVDTATLHLMRWIMGDWRRVKFFNRFLAGTVIPRIQMDLLPGVACAAHFVLIASESPQDIDDYVAAGRAMQRFWLTLTGLGLVMQPEMTPLIFGRYIREGRPFSIAPGKQEQARQLSRWFESIVGEHQSAHAVVMGRIGAGPPAVARSLRRPIEDLLLVKGTAEPCG